MSLYAAYYVGGRGKPYLIPQTVRYLKRDAKIALREQFIHEGKLIITEEYLESEYEVKPVNVEALR